MAGRAAPGAVGMTADSRALLVLSGLEAAASLGDLRRPAIMVGLRDVWLRVLTWRYAVEAG